jgi:thioredoxin 1
MTTSISHIDDLAHIRAQLQDRSWLVACLCAAWCDVCKIYRPHFEALTQRHGDACFAWIDIEDHAELLEDIDIENFPTILIQHQDKVLFLGPMLPDIQHAERLFQTLSASDTAAAKPNLQQGVPENWNFRALLLA